MATIKNNRNALIYAANSVTNGRLTGATVSISAGVASSILVPKGNTVPVPSSATLTAYATGYTTPGYVWEYRYGDSGTWNTLATTTNVLALTLDAAWLSAAGINTLVQYRVTVRETANGFTTGINQSQYIQSIPIIREGADGFNNVVVQLYARTATNTAPAVATTGQFTYYFNTGLIVGQPAGWSRNVTDGTGSYVWSIQTQVASTSTQKSLDNTAWSAPALYSKDGSPGQTGNSTALVYAYKRSTTLPTDNPGAVDYSFSSNSITTATLANSWQKTIPSGTDPLYVVAATASSNTGSDSIAANEWTSPVLLAQNGTSGNSVYVATIYKQSATDPGSPVATSSTYNFSTNILIPPSGWSVSQPATTTTPTWACNYTFSGALGSTVTGTGNWSATYIEAQSGTNGEYRDIIQLYLQSTTAPTKPTSVQYTFTGNVLGTVTGGTAGWSTTIPASSTTPTYVTTCPANTTTPGTAVTLTNWSTPVVIAQNGAGGLNSATINLYARNNSLSTAPTLTVSNSLTYTFSTGVLSGTLPSGWSTSIPAIANGSVLWVTSATAASAGATDTILAGEWSTPKISGSVGERGTKNLYSADSAYSSSWTLSPNAAGYASFAAKATSLIAAAAGNSLPTTPLAGDTVTFSSVDATFKGSISGYVLTVSSVTYGSVVIGQTLSGIGVLTGTTITSFISGTSGGIGTYGVSLSQTVAANTVITGNTNFVYTLTHDGTSWKTPATVIDGNLLVTGSVTASKINSNGLSIKDSEGNVILAAGTAIDWTKLGSASSNLTGLGYIGDLNATYGADASNLKGYGDSASLITDVLFEDPSWGTISGDWAVGAPAVINTEVALRYITASKTSTTSSFLTDKVLPTALLAPCNGGETLYLSAKWATDATATGTWALIARFYDKNKVVLTTNAEYYTYLTVPQASETSLEWPVLVPTGAAYVGYRVRRGSSGANTTAVGWCEMGSIRLSRSQSGATIGAPTGTYVGTELAESISGTIKDYNSSNNKNSTEILTPAVVQDGSAVDHTLNADGSANISFEWMWPASATSISYSISGYSLIVTSLTGLLQVGMTLYDSSGNILPDTKIIGIESAGTVGSAGKYILNNAHSAVSSTTGYANFEVQVVCSISGNIMTVSSVTGEIKLGQVLYGSGIVPNTYVKGYGTGTGGAGTYILSTENTASAGSTFGLDFSNDNIDGFLVKVLKANKTHTSFAPNATYVDEFNNYIYTSTTHGFVTGQPVQYTTPTSPPVPVEGLTSNQIYYANVSPLGNVTFSAVITGNTLDVKSVTSGVLGPGVYLTGSSVPTYTYITGFGTGTGGVGTYIINKSLTLTQRTMTGLRTRSLRLSYTEQNAYDGMVIDLSLSTTSTQTQYLTGGKSYTFGTSEVDETVYQVPANKRSFILYGVPADAVYTFGVQAFRKVEQSVVSSGLITSTISKPLYGSENPYNPATSVTFAGDVTGTVNGIAASSLESQSGAQAKADAAQSNAISTAATDATAKAAAAQAAAIAASISKSSNSVLSATVSLNAVQGAGFVAGDLTWDASGNRTGGKGVAMTPGGLVGFNSSGTKTFAIDTAGNATFGGDLNAASGTFSGSLTASAVNAVNTINLAGQAVTLPGSANGTAITGVSITLTELVANQPVYIIGTAECDTTGGVVTSGYRNGYIDVTYNGTKTRVYTTKALNIFAYNLSSGNRYFPVLVVGATSWTPVQSGNYTFTFSCDNYNGAANIYAVQTKR